MRIKMKKNYFTLKLAILIAMTVIGFFSSFLVGKYPIPLKTVVDIIYSQFFEMIPYWEPVLETVVIQVRLPRILLAILVGGALSISGASYQTLFKNPMVSPDILGVSSGAGFGAALAMIHNGTWYQVQVSALVFGMLAVAIAYVIGNLLGRREMTILVLAGIVVSSFFSALLNIVKTYADTDNQLPSITFWLMGGLGRGSLRDVAFMIPTAAVSLGLLYFLRYKIDLLAAGEEEAATMGVNIRMLKLAVIISSTFLTVVSVSVCGIVGWVGLVIPHISRAIIGASFARLSSVAFFSGGVFLLFIDNLIRGVEGVELPLGVLTALIGTPVFTFLIIRARRGWS